MHKIAGHEDLLSIGNKGGEKRIQLGIHAPSSKVVYPLFTV